VRKHEGKAISIDKLGGDGVRDATDIDA